MASNSGSRSSLSGSSPLAGRLREAAPATGRVDDRHVQQRIDVEVGHVVDEVAGETQQQVVGLLLDLRDAGVGAVGLVDQQDDGQLRLERLAQHEAGLRQRALDASTSSTTPSTIDRPRSTSPPKSAWPGVSMTLIVTGASVWMPL
jgi:hypothetical protein